MRTVRSDSSSLEQQALQFLALNGVVRLSRLVDAGITTATISRLAKRGEVLRLGRGLYQLPEQTVDANHDLAIVAGMVPSGVICLVSALAFHELTDTIPAKVWIAIGSKARKPAIAHPQLQVVRFPPEMLGMDVERHVIDGVSVPVTMPARTVVDLFRYRQRQGPRFKSSPGLTLAIEGLREVLRQRRATPAEIARIAERLGVLRTMRPYLEALTPHA
jgi:predicted transcriptional regulator of viral defense system